MEHVTIRVADMEKSIAFYTDVIGLKIQRDMRPRAPIVFLAETPEIDAEICISVRVWRLAVIALKSAQHFKGWWTGRAKTIIPCESPGIQSADLTVFDFKYVNTSYFPLGDPEWK